MVSKSAVLTLERSLPALPAGAFAAFGGIFFGYDSGYINGVTGSQVFIDAIEGPGAKALSSSHSSLIVSILSAGTTVGSLLAGDLADRMGRRPTIIAGTVIYACGVVVQMFAASALATIVVGRFVAGIGVGFVTAVIVLYMVSRHQADAPSALAPKLTEFPCSQSEICPKRVRGALLSCYRTLLSRSGFVDTSSFLVGVFLCRIKLTSCTFVRAEFCTTIGLMLGAIVDNYTQKRTDSGAYRIPIGVQVSPVANAFRPPFLLSPPLTPYYRIHSLRGPSSSA